MDMHRRRLLAAMASAGAAVTCTGLPLGGARANGMTRILVGFAPGGAADLVARALAEGLRTSGYTAIVENKAGAGGRIATDALLSASDGATLLFTPSTNLTLFPHIYKDLRYTVDEFAAYGTACEFDMGFAVGASSPARTLPEFLEMARKDKQMAAYGTPGTGTIMHFLGVLLSQASKVPLTHVPYKGGSMALTDAMGGVLPLLVTTLPAMIPMHKSGKIRILASSGRAASPDVPEVPTFASLGFPDLTISEYFVLLGQKGRDSARAAAMSEAMAAAVRSPVFERAVRQLYFSPLSTDPQALAQRLKQDDGFWAGVVKRTGYTPEA
ncbi:putattive exported protein [Bordetella ansorpii]|uniref:Putattive exported protein n=1 Tax=Bordetella ansorpii TaxID=288768 RepID=A0A157P5D4_9BORD|nr:tripartite tricarboxylate transporter substrate-binding protein [Bordetella ansorpii]SAI28733.1 putattive exported protein [Bordetella ansorpii]